MVNPQFLVGGRKPENQFTKHTDHSDKNMPLGKAQNLILKNQLGPCGPQLQHVQNTVLPNICSEIKSCQALEFWVCHYSLHKQCQTNGVHLKAAKSLGLNFKDCQTIG